MAEPQLLLNYTGHLPECPTWSAEEHALYWADILEGEIHRYHLPTAEHTVLSFHEEVGCFALREQGGFIVAMRNGQNFVIKAIEYEFFCHTRHFP